jgi:uncharacterized protein YcbK (DUF882 family)
MNWADVRYFTADEFACHCGCGIDGIQYALVHKLDALRHTYGKPLTVTSGFRCPDHNQRVSSTGATGPHTTGLSVDLGVSGREAYQVLRLALADGWTGIGIQQKGGGRFIHLDIIPDSFAHKRSWIWSY